MEKALSHVDAMQALLSEDTWSQAFPSVDLTWRFAICHKGKILPLISKQLNYKT